MVYSNGFSVKIITDGDQDKLQRNGYNYVALNNNTEYKIQLVNDRSTDAMAEVFIEGEMVGIWLVPSRDNIIFDRPANVARKFTFFGETDIRAIKAGVIPGESMNGVIRVVFYPKKQMEAILRSPYISIPGYIPFIPITSRTISGEVKQSIPMHFPPGVTVENIPTQFPPGVTVENIPTRLPPGVTVERVPIPTQISQQSFTTILPSTTQVPILSSQSELSTIRPLSPRQLYQSGATVLGRQSNQIFGTTKRFSDNEIDWANKTEIIIRLILRTEQKELISTIESPSIWSREFILVKDITPKIPPRIDY